MIEDYHDLLTRTILVNNAIPIVGKPYKVLSSSIPEVFYVD